MKIVSNRLTKWLINKHVIESENQEIYQHGILILIMNIVDTISILLIALIFNKLIIGVFYLIGFCFLRKYAGGYHAKSIIGCYVMTVGFSIAIFIMSHLCKMPLLIIFIIWGLGSLIICVFAPVQNVNRVLDTIEYEKFRKRAISILCVESLIMWLFFYLGYKLAAEGIFMGFCLVVISMIIEFINYWANTERH